MSTKDNLGQAPASAKQRTLEIPPETSDKFDRQPYRNIILTVVFILLISFLTIMLNQIAQLVNLATTLHPTFGRIVLRF